MRLKDLKPDYGSIEDRRNAQTSTLWDQPGGPANRDGSQPLKQIEKGFKQTPTRYDKESRLDSLNKQSPNDSNYADKVNKFDTAKSDKNAAFDAMIVKAMKSSDQALRKMGNKPLPKKK